MTKPSFPVSALPAVQATRRRLLKMFAGAPMLPLGGAFVSASVLSACSSSDDDSDSPAPGTPVANFVSASFIGMAAPSLSDAAAMATTTVGSKLQVNFDDGSNQTYSLAYAPFFTTGDIVKDLQGNDVIAGGYYDINNAPIMDKSGTGAARQLFSDAPDGTSMIHLPDAKVDGVANPVFVVVQFEYVTKDLGGNDTYGKLPSPIAVLTLDQDPDTGKLTLARYHNVDMSQAHGLWITCGASLSPWNTHLSSEEYEPDAFTAKSNDMFLGYSNYLYGDSTTAKPYHYGHLPEITVNPDGSGTVKKHYCLGRISHELIQVMPDERTALMGDDYTNGGLFMFVADNARDLSSGTLYVAHYDQVLTEKSTARMNWIKLGHANSAEIEAMANSLEPTDIMDVQYTDPGDPTYTLMYCDGKANWIKVVPGMEKAAAFLETHRYANLVGASMAFTKMEGTTVNAKDKIAYSALANIQASMVSGDAFNAAHNVLFPTTVAGGVLAHALKGSVLDTDGNAINSEWVPGDTHLELSGEDLDTPDALGNTANADKIASPDNLKFSEKLRTLFIGEDSGNHVNNFLWAYNVDTKELTRILSTPAGAESTGLHAVDEVNGWTYIMSNFQHPGDWKKTGLHSVVWETLDPLINANYKDKYGAAVGYVTGELTSINLVKKTA
ncbi:PhoX family protein [Bordetella tumulicola]|uniref:PhoX family protein n=1 Tax=Bordetella tumulicola TaxID=1649133 RepID=UPI0039F02DD2